MAASARLRRSDKRRVETRTRIVETLPAGVRSGSLEVDGPTSVSHDYVWALVYRDEKRGGF